MSEARREQDRKLDEAAEAVRGSAGDRSRDVVIVTGSGLSGLASVVSVESRIDLANVPHFPRPSVVGHSSSLFVGEVRGIGTLLFAGRVHLYEGRPVDEVVFAVRLARRLGGRVVLVTNAAGGVSAYLEPGDLMLIRDQINLTFRDLSCPGEGSGPSPPHARRGPFYSPSLGPALREAARREKIVLKEGVYAANLGPAFETGAESEMLRRMGADAVGMSTVLEVSAARQAGMEVAGISCIANRIPAWGRTRIVTHEEVIACMRGAQEKLKRLIPAWVERIASDTHS